MPDNWGFVLAAYALTALVLGGYWRRLHKRERESIARPTGLRRMAPRPPVSAHPRSNPSSPSPLS
jgi:hypothetical protein